MDSVDQIISQSIEKTIDKLMPEDKESFYNLLRIKYKLDFRYISKTFYTFYLALKEFYPKKHYALEAAIVKTMHEDTLKGKYKLTDEIEAFIIITTIIQADENRTIDAIRGRLDTIDFKRGVLQRELSDKQEKFEKLNGYFFEVNGNLKEREKKGKLTEE